MRFIYFNTSIGSYKNLNIADRDNKNSNLKVAS